VYIQDKDIQDKDKKSVQRTGFLGGSCLLGQLKKKSVTSPAPRPRPTISDSDTEILRIDIPIER
jgi:hypothetical protein